MTIVASSSPILRAKTEDDERWDDPSEDLLFELLLDIDKGFGSFLILEQAADPNAQTYAQVARRDDGSYAVEYREGSADRHYGTTVPDMRTAHKLLAGWAFELAGWKQDAQWTRVRF